MFKKQKKLVKICSIVMVLTHLYWKKNTTLPQKPQKMCLKNQQSNKDSNFVEIS